MNDTLEKCNQLGCTESAFYRFTWPGRDEVGVCRIHAIKIARVAEALGMHLQLIPMHQEETS